MEKESQVEESGRKDADTVTSTAYVRHVRASALVPFLLVSVRLLCLMNGGNTFYFHHKRKAIYLFGAPVCLPFTGLFCRISMDMSMPCGFVVLGIAGMCVALIVRQCGTD